MPVSCGDEPKPFESGFVVKRLLMLPIVFIFLLQAAVSARQPNVVLIMTDDQGYGDMSCHGNPYLKTPNIDRLYNAGMRAGKGNAYDGGHRAACFLHWPAGGLAGGRNVEPITAHFDLLPTLVDLCRLRSPQGVVFDGKSLVPLLRADGAGWPERTLFVHHQGGFGQRIRDDRPIEYKDFAVMTNRWLRCFSRGPETRESGVPCCAAKRLLRAFPCKAWERGSLPPAAPASDLQPPAP